VRASLLTNEARLSEHGDKRVPSGAVMDTFDYLAPAELFSSRNAKRRWPMRYRRFDTAAEAIRFAMEEIAPPVLFDVYIQVDDERFGAKQIRELYESIAMNKEDRHHVLQRAVVMKRMAALVSVVAAIGAASAAAALFGGRAPGSPLNSVFTSTKWPFLLDQWGIGEAFVCRPVDCGVNRSTSGRRSASAIARMAYMTTTSWSGLAIPNLWSGDIQPLDESHPITVGWTHWRSRIYFATDDEGREQWLISVAFHDGCDAVVALAAVGQGDPTALEPSVIAFLKNRLLVRWVKKELGLEYVYRE
jgi:hypothetical protein